MKDRIAFVRACLDREQEIALAAHATVWVAEGSGRRDDEFIVFPDSTPSGIAVAFGAKNADHIAMQDPAHTLARIDSDRKILDAAEGYSPELEHGDNGEWAFETVIQLIAQRYAGWPGWREEWRQ